MQGLPCFFKFRHVIFFLPSSFMDIENVPALTSLCSFWVQNFFFVCIAFHAATPTDTTVNAKESLGPLHQREDAVLPVTSCSSSSSSSAAATVSALPLAAAMPLARTDAAPPRESAVVPVLIAFSSSSSSLPLSPSAATTTSVRRRKYYSLKYDEDEMAECVNLVVNDGLSPGKVHALHPNVPTSTIRSRAQRHPESADGTFVRAGPVSSTYLTYIQKSLLHDWIVQCADNLFPVTQCAFITMRTFSVSYADTMFVVCVLLSL